MSPSLPPAALMAAAAAPDLTAGSPVALMARVRARSDGLPVLWWWQGQVHGKRPGEMAQRLMDIQGVGFNRVRRLPDGHWESTMSEAGYYQDAASGAVLDAWANPYSGKVVKPAHNRLKLRYLIADDGEIRPSMPGLIFDGRVEAPLLSGDLVWVTERLAAEFPRPADLPGAPKGLSGAPMEVSRFCARLADVANGALEVVPATMSHTTLWSFYPWMEMPADEGYVLTEIVGRKVAGAAELPEALRQRIQGDHPGFLEDPGL